MLCPVCGRDNPDYAAFCAGCGHGLSASPAPPAPPLQFDVNPASSPGRAQSSGFSEPPPPPSGAHSSRGATGIIAAIIAVVVKFKTIIFAILLKAKYLFAIAKFGKILTTMSSMLFSIGIYTTLFGWRLATGFVLLLFVHEMGHVLVAWWKKLPVSAPMFVPFMGAVIFLQQHPQDALTESQIAYGGPALGALGCTIVWASYYVIGHPLLLAIASVGLFLNLFNMAPVSPLDGGRICAAISPRIWLIGLIAMVLWFLFSPHLIVLLIIIIGGVRIRAQWKTMNTDEYFKVDPQWRLTMTLLYLALAAYLWIAHVQVEQTLMDWINANTSMRL